MNRINLMVFILLFTLKINAQNNNKWSLLVGGNVCNPNQLIEGSETEGDFNMLKPYGNMFAALCYKNKFALGFGKELNEHTFLSAYPKDFYIFSRCTLLKDSLKLRPYIEIGYTLNTYGSDRYYYKSQNSYNYGIGLVYKLNSIISLDLHIGMQHRELKLENKADWNNDKTDLTIDRFMIKTGLIFKVL